MNDIQSAFVTSRIGEPEGLDQCLVARAFAVEGESGAAVADLVDAALESGEGERGRRLHLDGDAGSR